MTTSTRRRLAGTSAAALAIALALTGCGSGSGSSTSEYAPGPNGAARSDGGNTYRSPSDTGDDTTRRNRMTDPREDGLSTFALDIDTGSYTRFRDAVRNGETLPPSEIRTEEFVNYFRQDYEAPRDGLGVSIDAATLRFAPSHRLVRVGISSAVTSDEDRPDADVVLVVDTSGSMSEAGKMETTKTALRTLATSLRTTDRVAIVRYDDEADLILEPTPVRDRNAVLDGIAELEPGGSTNAEAGLTLGYDTAARMHDEARGEHRMTRVVLVSDGVANVGSTSPGGILDRIGREARSGVNLVSVGVGMQDYNDRLLEQLADTGDGWHVYVDTADEAERVFATGLTGSLVVAAKDAKAQVEFDPARVAGYRLIGYENRAVADEDFRDDRVDGGEVFAGHTTTALYDVELRRPARDADRDRAFVTATVRYHDGSGEAVERTGTLSDAECARDVAQASARLQQDLVVALLTDHLVGGPWSESGGTAELRRQAADLPERLDGDRDVAELVDLVDRVAT